MNTSNRHTFSALFLAFILFTYNINNVVIVIDFLINQDTIAKTLCVQKEEQKGCNGKCQLVKELNLNVNSNTKDAPQQSTIISIAEYNYIQPINEIDITRFASILPTKLIDTTTDKIITKFYEIDIPPPIFS